MTVKQKEINVLLVDDHELILEGLKHLIHKKLSINVVGTAKNGTDAVAIIKRDNLLIDIVITDIKMPEMNGLELTSYIKKNHPLIKVLVLSLYKDIEYVKTIVEAEAEGYLLKNTDEDELLKAICHIYNDGTYYAKDILTILKNGFSKSQKSSVSINEISKRELEIIQLICKEYSSVEIAETLFISKSTVDVHRKNIMQKTEVKNIVGLIKYALENNIINSL